MALVVLLISWLPISYTEYSLPVLVIGILLLDAAVQAVHVTNQSLILPYVPKREAGSPGDT
ncbi:hypothetical protein HMSSN036_48620 [Paenibacillus macerans]|nr:hypothetical protein HMSSN036_48620 [Paenibacillus macerans]